MENKDLTKRILEEIKKSKKYKGIPFDVVMEEIGKFLKRNPEIEKKGIIKREDIKEIKSKLHKLYSGYSLGKKSRRDKILKKLKKNPGDLTEVKKLLRTSISTKERLNYYAELYIEIFKLTGIPETIVDLGCGMNPVSYPFMKLKKLRYHAFDINEDEVEFLNNYFEIMKKEGLEGKASILNLMNKNMISKIPESDMILLFKVIDLINEKNKKNSESLIRELITKTKHIVISFPTKTLGGKKMNYPKRKWFELMIKRIGLKFQKIIKSNELFYVIYK